MYSITMKNNIKYFKLCDIIFIQNYMKKVEEMVVEKIEIDAKEKIAAYKAALY